MKNISDNFKIITKKIKQQKTKITIVGENKEVVAKELKYSFDGNLFRTIMKQIEITLKNANEIKDKNINFQYGLYINSDFEYVDLGDFYIKDVEDDKKKEELVVTGYDKMIQFMKTFKQSELQLNYPCSMLKLVKKICEVCGVELYSTNFFNSGLEVDEDYFTAQEVTYRDVLEKVTQSTLTTAFIKDNKLYFHHINGETVEILDKSYLSNLIIKEKFGPVNALVLGRGDIEDNIEASDAESITKNGRCEIRFDENEFIEYKREQFIDSMFEQIKGLEYYSFESSDIGVMWLEPCDLIEVRDREEISYKTIYLKAEVTINTGIETNIEADVLEETNTKYKVTSKEEKNNLKVERLAKKNEGIIQDLVQETTEQNQKISEVTQTVNELNSKIGDIADITTSKESTYAIVEFEKINQSEPIYVKIHPIGKNISYLYPRENLYPSDDLFMTVRTLRFTNTTTGEIIDYELPTDLLYYDASNYDEFILDYDALSCEVNKKVGYNADGSTHLLDTVKTIKYDFPRIELTDGDYKIELLGYNNAYLFVRLMAQNYYTTQFATKAEMNSEIKQTTEEIELSTDKKLSNYSTTTEMNAAISVKANEINSTVKEIYSTKTETMAAKSEAIDSANASTDNKLKNYSTTSQMNSAINQKADSITSTVSSQITTAKTEAVNSANSSTDSKLKNYSTTTQMNSAINQKADSITSTVAKTYTTKTENTNTLNSAKSYTDTQVTSAKSEIKQTTDIISAEVSKKVNNTDYTSAQILLKINNDTSSTVIKSDKLDVDAIAKFTNSKLATKGSTVINGDNITTGTIDASKAKITNISADNITSGTLTGRTLNGSKINGGSIALESTEKDDISVFSIVDNNYSRANVQATATMIQFNSPLTRGACSIGFDSNTGEGYVSVEGNVYAYNIESDARLKENIKVSEIKAIDVINEIVVKSFDWKRNKKHVIAGFIAQEMEKIDNNFVLKKPIKDKKGNFIDYKYYINELPIIATLVKGMQEQQKQIDLLSNKIKEMEEKINEII